MTTTASLQNDAAKQAAPQEKPIIGISMGDPAGVGPELCLRILADEALQRVCIPVVFGDSAVLQRVADVCGLIPPENVVPRSELDPTHLRVPALVDCGILAAQDIRPRQAQVQCGAAAFEYIRAAAGAAMARQTAAIVTAPINKHAMHMAGIHYPGHTEMLSGMTGAGEVRMMFASDKMVVTLATIHVGYRDVPDLLTRASVGRTIAMTAQILRKLGRARPHLVVCGLNPHAGESGLFGSEEETIIQPAVEDARKRGIDVEGPLPADTAFVPSVLARTDAYVAMYHDQGLIPFKMQAFSQGVNITLGLPIVRTSPDHGTAFDIAWKGMASPESLRQSVLWAVRLTEARETGYGDGDNASGDC